MKLHFGSSALGLVVASLLSCGGESVLDFEGLASAPGRLRDWELFTGSGSDLEPAAGVIPYDLITALFSDYAAKDRYVRLPRGAQGVVAASYSETDVFDFPVGTVLVKTFSYPADLRQPGVDVRRIETRLLIHQESGWIGLPYVWNEAQDEAVLKIAGTRVEVAWRDAGGERTEHSYLVPNANQCKGCHRVDGENTQPIGPKARYLNRDVTYAEGVRNQLIYWVSSGMLSGAPAGVEDATTVPVWDDPESGTVDERARAYLEVNCAHCHNPGGPARTAGLDLGWGPQRPMELGVYKSPIAAGRGTGDRLYGIVPGEPDESILFYRLLSLDPGIMMPELGRRLVHEEGIALVRQWIEEMPGRRPSPAPS